MQRLLILYCALTLLVSPVFSQAFLEYSGPGSQGAGSLNFQIAPENSAIAGDPYFQSEWQHGVVHYASTVYEVKELKYNICLDELVFHQGNQIFLVPDKEKIVRFTVGDDTFLRVQYQNQHGFLQLLEQGTAVNLLVHYACSIKPGNPSKGYIPGTPDEYVKKESYYIQRPGDVIVPINPKRGAFILDHVGTRRADTEKFIASNKLRMRKLDDLIEVIRYLNSVEPLD